MRRFQKWFNFWNIVWCFLGIFIPKSKQTVIIKFIDMWNLFKSWITFQRQNYFSCSSVLANKSFSKSTGVKLPPFKETLFCFKKLNRLLKRIYQDIRIFAVTTHKYAQHFLVPKNLNFCHITLWGGRGRPTVAYENSKYYLISISGHSLRNLAFWQWNSQLIYYWFHVKVNSVASKFS